MPPDGNPSPRACRRRPATAVVRGMDPDGAQWTMRLYGPGALNVVGVDGDVFTRADWHLAGIDRHDHRRGGDHDLDPPGRPRFIPTRRQECQGLLPELDRHADWRAGQDRRGAGRAISGPSRTASSPSTCPISIWHIPRRANRASRRKSTRPRCRPAKSIIPQGVLTLRFGGVDVDYTPAGGTPLNQTGQSNEFQISLGLPVVQGTSIIVNTVNSDGEANSPRAQPAFQDYATFLVTGRLNLFQANKIDGNTTAGLWSRLNW